jgi:hypothetical protein
MRRIRTLKTTQLTWSNVLYTACTKQRALLQAEANGEELSKYWSLAVTGKSGAPM